MDLIFPIPWAVNGDKEEIPQYADADGKVSFQIGFGEDYEKILTSDPASKNIERKKLNYILNKLCVAVNTLSQQDGLPVGMPIPWPSWSLPEGNFTVYDGRYFNTSQNPKLAALFPGGQLLDLRGVVIRGVDANRGLDPNRGLLTYQEDTTQRLQGLFTTDSFAVTFQNPFYNAGNAGKESAHGTRGAARYVGFDNALSVRTSSESRMKNVALYYITKAG